ncbi:MAG: DNA-directed RNA polymerase subunit omega [Chitinophagales bacterium]|nr:DNA-directed RNA polymerase subunit omega [Chitinophagales bacterium]
MDKIREYRNLDAPESIEPKQMADIKAVTGNTYKSLNIIAKRANQIGVELKNELHDKLQEFASTTDTLEEVLENREQIEISKYYEKLSHPTILATEEFVNDKLFFKNKENEEETQKD